MLRFVAARRFMLLAVLASFAIVATAVPVAAQSVLSWQRDFQKTDFERRSVALNEFVTYGRRDSIPPIDAPRFVSTAEAAQDIGDLEPVVSIGIDGDFRAYPIRVLLFHEIVNDVVGGAPVVVSYCALCNSAIVFDRRLDDAVLEFGNTGTYRHFGMVMYDKATESWWQQFIGEAVIGERLGKQLTSVPARLESLARFRARAPTGRVLVPTNAGFRAYGLTPYGGMDSQPLPPSLARQRFPYDLPAGVDPLERVVVVGDEAWTLALLSAAGEVSAGDLVLTWEPGQNSVHDQQVIAEGRDVGNVVVQRRGDRGLRDVRYDVSFAFAFAAFVPDGILHTR